MDFFKDVFKDIENKVLISDIIHVLEYIWIIAHIKHKEGSAESKKYVISYCSYYKERSLHILWSCREKC